MNCQYRQCVEEATDRVVMKGFLNVTWEAQVCAKHKHEIEKNLELS